VGFVETITPLLAKATHSETEGQETPLRVPTPLTRCHAPAPPEGLCEVRTSPAESTATHSDADGHEMPLIETP
jgi:hypothetical protein